MLALFLFIIRGKTMSKKQFEFNLSEEISYAYKGDIKKTTLLVLKSPSSKQGVFARRLQQYIMRAFKENQETQKVEIATSQQTFLEVEEQDIPGDILLGLLFMSDKIKIEDVEKDFKNLMTSDCCLLGGETALTSDKYDSLSITDTTNLMGEYLANFLLLSLLSPQKK